MKPLALILFASLVSLGMAQTPPPAAAPPKPATGPIFLTNVRIEVGNGTTIEKGSILIDRDRIVAVGEGLSAPAGVKTVDGKGAVVYPGFIDAYTTSGVKIPDAKPAGIPPDTRNTAPATMWHANRRGIRPEVSAAKNLDLKAPFTERYKQGILTIVLSPGGATLSGTAAVVNLTPTPSVLVADAAADIAFRGAGGGQGYPGTLFGVTALLRQVLIDAQNNPAGTKDASLEALQPVLSGKIPAIIRASAAREIVRADRLADEFGLKPILYGASEGWRALDILTKKRLPVLLTLDLPDAPDRKPQTGPNAVPQEVLEERYQVWKERIENAKKLSEAGVQLAFSSGTSFDGLLSSVRKLIDNGLPKKAALEALTLGAAKIFGLEKDLGTIEVGKVANLVILSGDFATKETEVVSVVVGGELIPVKQEAAKEGGK